MFDKDGNGHIDVNEMQAMLSSNDMNNYVSTEAIQ